MKQFSPSSSYSTVSPARVALLAAAAIALLSTARSQNISDTVYPVFNNTAWAGPVRLRENSTIPKFNYIEATLVMPRLGIPENPHAQADQYTAAYWIGFDGYVVPGYDRPSAGVSGLWQAGVLMSIWTNGTTEYTGFYEWVPLDPVSISASDLSISEGDSLLVTLFTSDDGLFGNVTLTNLCTSQTFAFGMDAPTTWRGPTWASAGDSAEWIVEAGTYVDGPQYVLPNWGNATFAGAKACRMDGECVTPAGNTNNTVITEVFWEDMGVRYTRTYLDGSDVTVEYVEESVGA